MKAYGYGYDLRLVGGKWKAVKDPGNWGSNVAWALRRCAKDLADLKEDRKRADSFDPNKAMWERDRRMWRVPGRWVTSGSGR